MEFLESDLNQCLSVLKQGCVILFPTDTIWGLGCDATNADAVNKVLNIKQRHAAQGVIVLLADAGEVSNYADALSASLQENIGNREKPTTVIYNGAKNVAPNAIPEDKTIAIRIVKDAFCKEMIRRFGKPVVSTSANIHGRPSPKNFSEIDPEVIRAVDYTAKHRQTEENLFQPSTILKIKPDGSFETIRP